MSIANLLLVVIFMVENIKALCERHKTTLKSLERELGFGNGTIARWDDNSPAISKVLKVADYFDVDVYTIIYGEKQKSPPALRPTGERLRLLICFVG